MCVAAKTDSIPVPLGVFLGDLNRQIILSWDQRRSGQHAIHKPTILQEREVSEVISKMCIQSIITVAGEAGGKGN